MPRSCFLTDENLNPIDATNPLNISGGATQVSASQTRPNNGDAYTAGDVVGTNAATNLTFSSVSNVSGGHIIITGATLEIDVNAVPTGMSSFRLHLYSSAPTAIADNTAYNLPSADRSKYLGYIEFPTPVDLGDTLWAQVENVNMKRKLASASTTLYGMLETRGAYTPSAECVKKVTINVVEV
jgi:hypothetical protein